MTAPYDVTATSYDVPHLSYDLYEVAVTSYKPSYKRWDRWGVPVPWIRETSAGISWGWAGGRLAEIEGMRTALVVLGMLAAVPAIAGPSQRDRESWGVVRDWQDVTGNRDGIWENEDLAAGERGWFRGGIERPSTRELADYERWKRLEMHRMGVTSVGHSGNKTAQGIALNAMARYGRDARAFDDGFVTSDAIGAAPARSVYVQRWDAVGPQKVVTVIVPGYTESTQDWMHVANKMNAAGSRVYVFDPPGQGLTDGRKGDVEDSREWQSAYRAVLAKAQAENPGAKVVVMGHSTGGGVVADDFRDRVNGQIHTKAPDGLVLSAPYLDLRPTMMNKISGVLANVPGANRIQVPVLVKLSDDDLGVTRLKQLQGATGAKNTLHFIDVMSEMVKRHERWLDEAVSGIAVPLGVVQGVDDNVTNPDASKTLVRKTAGAHFTSVDTGSHDLQWDAKGVDALMRSWNRVVSDTLAGTNADRGSSTRAVGGTAAPVGTAAGAGMLRD